MPATVKTTMVTELKKHVFVRKKWKYFLAFSDNQYHLNKIFFFPPVDDREYQMQWLLMYSQLKGISSINPFPSQVKLNTDGDPQSSKAW